MAETKITKKERFANVRDIVEASNAANKVELLAFIDTEVEHLEAKAAKAAERAAAKKAEGDELRATIQSLITDELQTADQLTLAIEDPSVTKAMVVARLGQLVRAELVVKENMKVDGRTLVGYRLA